VKPVVSTMWSGESEAWNELVDVLDFRTVPGGLPRWMLTFLRMTKGRDAVILRGTVTRRERYRDYLGAIALRLRPGRKPMVVISDATIEPGSRSLSEHRILSQLLPLLSKVLIRAADGPHVRWCVLSTDELETFPRTWGVPPERVVFTPFGHTLWKGEADTAPATTGDYVWSGGNSLRDYPMLLGAVAGLTVPVRIATTQRLGALAPCVDVESVPHDEFLAQMAGARAVVVPLSASVRSAGQQTYLNAMALGRVTVVTDRPGVRDYVEDGVTGVVAPATVAGLRAALMDVLDPGRAEHYQQVARCGRDTVLREYSPVAYYERLLAVAKAL
jgi:Glycosyl transferases group 1